MLYLSIILGVTNIFMKNVSFGQSSMPEYPIDLHEEYEAEGEVEDEVEGEAEDEAEDEVEGEAEEKHETKEDNNMST
jgi:hypothetical protein